MKLLKTYSGILIENAPLMLAFFFVTIAIFGGEIEVVSKSTRDRITVDGKHVGYVVEGNSKTIVQDKNGSELGYVTSSGTYRKGNRKISDSQLPGLLFCGEF